MANPQLPPPGVPIVELRTPDPTQVFYRVLIGRETPIWQNNSPIKRGTLYSDLQGADVRIAAAYPLLYFVRETVPIGSNTVAGMTQDEFVVWEFSNDPDSESTYNAEISYLADATTNPVFARVYTIRRDVYEATPAIATASPLTALIGVRITNGGAGYKNAQAEYDCYGDDAEIQFVISDGEIISGIVTKEGTNFNDGSVINIIGDGSGATCEPIIQPLGAILTSQKKQEFADGDPMQHEFVRVIRVYEVLPGPWVPRTRYSEDLGPIQMRSRAVLNTGQRGGIVSATGTLNYEGRDGSSIVLIETEEQYSNGSGVPGPGGNPNTAYPRITWATYDDERGEVQHYSQIVLADPLGSPPDATLVRQFGNLIRTWYREYPDNPYFWKQIVDTWVEVTVNDQLLTSEFGGAIATHTETTNEPGFQSPERGLMVISSKTVTKSPDEQTLTTVKNPLSAWPILPGFHCDETTGIVVNYTKQVVASGTPYPGTTAQSDDCALVKIQGPFIEDQPFDWDKTIRIISVVDLNTLPKKQCWTISHPVNFPPQLLSVKAIWTDFSERSTSASQPDGVDSVSVSVSSGSNGGVAITSRDGYRGNATGRLERSYFYGPPNSGLVPAKYKIQAVSGSVIFMATSSGTGESENSSGAITFSDSFRSQGEVHHISDHLVGSYQITSNDPSDVVVGTQLIHRSPTVGPVTAISGATQVTIIALGTPATMDVEIPQSVPTQLVSGQEIVWDVIVKEHPFGIWEMNVIYVTVP